MANRWSLVTLSKWPEQEKRSTDEGGTTFAYGASSAKLLQAIAAELKGDHVPVKSAREGAEWLTLLAIISTHETNLEYLKKQLHEMRDTIDAYLLAMDRAGNPGSISLFDEGNVKDPDDCEKGKGGGANGRPH